MFFKSFLIVFFSFLTLSLSFQYYYNPLEDPRFKNDPAYAYYLFKNPFFLKYFYERFYKNNNNNNDVRNNNINNYSARSENNKAAILKLAYDSSPNNDGAYRWNYESEDGSQQDQIGFQRNNDNNNNNGQIVVLGEASWIDPEGGIHKLKYSADENGYHPETSDAPVGPKIPDAIIRSLEWNAAHPEEE